MFTKMGVTSDFFCLVQYNITFHYIQQSRDLNASPVDLGGVIGTITCIIQKI